MKIPAPILGFLFHSFSTSINLFKLFFSKCRPNMTVCDLHFAPTSQDRGVGSLVNGHLDGREFRGGLMKVILL